MPLLKKGSVIRSDVSGLCYRVTSGRIAEGGFGEIYRGSELDDRRDPVRDVAIKVLTNPLSCMVRRISADFRRTGTALSGF